jgi:hypothetical protein
MLESILLARYTRAWTDRQAHRLLCVYVCVCVCVCVYIYILSCDGVTIDGVWIDNWIC